VCGLSFGEKKRGSARERVQVTKRNERFGRGPDPGSGGPVTPAQSLLGRASGSRLFVHQGEKRKAFIPQEKERKKKEGCSRNSPL